MRCPSQTRRSLLLAALATGAGLATKAVAADTDEEPAGSDEKPQKGDLLVHSEGEQEGKLMDRLLRPNTTLGNEAQTKKFTADTASVDRHAHVSTFYLQKNSSPVAFTNTREFG